MDGRDGKVGVDTGYNGLFYAILIKLIINSRLETRAKMEEWMNEWIIGNTQNVDDDGEWTSRKTLSGSCTDYMGTVFLLDSFKNIPFLVS